MNSAAPNGNGKPAMPEHWSEAELMKLPKQELAERCWAATVNADFAAQSAAEAWANVAELVAILEDDKHIAAVRLYRRMKAHHQHTVACRMGSCEDEYGALLKRGLGVLSP